MFLLLPPRSLVGRQFANHLRQFLPLPLESIQPEESTAWLENLVGKIRDVYLVFRDELPFDAEPLQALKDGYGAEPGDEIIEVNLGTPPGTASVTRLSRAA